MNIKGCENLLIFENITFFQKMILLKVYCWQYKLTLLFYCSASILFRVLSSLLHIISAPHHLCSASSLLALSLLAPHHPYSTSFAPCNPYSRALDCSRSLLLRSRSAILPALQYPFSGSSLPTSCLPWIIPVSHDPWSALSGIFVAFIYSSIINAQSYFTL